MTRAFVVAGLVAALVAGCIGAPPTPSSGTSRNGFNLSPTGPVVACGGLPTVDCTDALAAVAGALDPFAPTRGELTTVTMGSGVYCPTPALLFSETSCPQGGLSPADGGQWVGHALVAFERGSDEAYLNLERLGPLVRSSLIAIATPPAEPTPPVEAPSSLQPHLQIANGTTLTVLVRVNGLYAGRFDPASAGELDLAALPAPPWHVVAATPGGRPVATLDVPAGGTFLTPQPAGESVSGGVQTIAALTCGNLWLFAGTGVPRGGPQPASGSGGCSP